MGTASNRRGNRTAGAGNDPQVVRDTISIVSGTPPPALRALVDRVNRGVRDGSLGRQFPELNLNVHVSVVIGEKGVLKDRMIGLTRNPRTPNPTVHLQNVLRGEFPTREQLSAEEDQLRTAIHEIFGHAFSRVELFDPIHNMISAGLTFDEAVGFLQKFNEKINQIDLSLLKISQMNCMHEKS